MAVNEGRERYFVVSGIGCSEGQEVVGVEACVLDKWSDRCGDGSACRHVCPSVHAFHFHTAARILVSFFLLVVVHHSVIFTTRSPKTARYFE